MALFALGIDTGGTFTDGVVCDLDHNTILAKTKVITTRHKLTIAINNCLDNLLVELDKQILKDEVLRHLKMVSLSTTLATNGIVEGQGAEVGLILIGFDLEKELPTPHSCKIPGGCDIKGRIKEPLDLDVYKKIVLIRFKELIEKCDFGEVKFKIEPGRFISAEASIILAQINTIKYNGYKRFAGIDAGFNTLIRPTMYDSYHHIIPCDINTKKKDVKYDIAGPICESGDILGKNRDLPELNEGDYLAILDAGAYGFTMSSNYNARGRTAEVLVDGDNFSVIRKRETYEDLISLEK